MPSDSTPTAADAATLTELRARAWAATKAGESRPAFALEIAAVEMLREAKTDLDKAREWAESWRGSQCSTSELADPANGFSFPWETEGASS